MMINKNKFILVSFIALSVFNVKTATSSDSIEINFGAINGLNSNDPKTIEKLLETQNTPVKETKKLQAQAVLNDLKKKEELKKNIQTPNKISSPNITTVAKPVLKIPKHMNDTIYNMAPLDDADVETKNTKIISNKPSITDRIKLGFGKTVSSIKNIIPGSKEKKVTAPVQETALSNVSRALSPPDTLKTIPIINKSVAKAPLKADGGLPPIYDDNSYMPALPIVPVKTEIAEVKATNSNKTEFTLTFADRTTGLSEGDIEKLRKSLEILQKDLNKKANIISYAKNTNNTIQDGKKISLERALSVRTFYTDNGIKPNRLDVQAFGKNDLAEDDKIYLILR